MPRLGLGTFKARSEEARKATLWALEAGYTHIDTASIYKNEEEIGNACREAELDRKKLFITSKVSPYEQGYEKAMAACNKSLERLGMDYLDLCLIHWPGVAKQDIKSELNQSVRLETWRALEQLYREGKCRSIGVSNYTSSHLRELLLSCQIPPMVNQVEVHPYLTQESLRKTCKEMGIQVVAYASLGCGELLKDPLVISTASHYGRTPSQILLRWGLERDLVVIPKSLRREKIFENADIFDWSIGDTCLIPLDNLNQKKHFCWSPEGVL